MRFPVEAVDLIVFDCDGVILDSNELKSRAFFEVTRPHGEELARKFVDHHKAHAGVSRQEKFRYFVSEILKADPAVRRDLEAELTEAYAAICRTGLRTCRTIPGFREFLASLPATISNFVVSGGAETEVRQSLMERGLAGSFRRILGNPRSKRDNMILLDASGDLEGRGFYFGDGQLDHELAREFGLDFVFVSGASEWTDAVEGYSGHRIRDFRELIGGS